VERIDSHAHFTREYLPELLLPILKRNKFDAVVVVSKSVEENAWLLDQASRHDFIRGVVCYGEPHPGHAKFLGICANPSEPRPLGSARLSAPCLDLPPAPALVARIAEAHPDVHIAIDHVGRPSLMENVRPEELFALARFPNVFVKISGLITDAPTQWKAAEFAPWVRGALAAFGPERVMFGSDWPTYLPTGTWKEALAAFTQALGAQTMETREHLLGGTARRFYRLGDAA
jgi:L-fuconolactonase